MPRDFCKVTLTGRVHRAPDLAYTSEGSLVARLLLTSVLDRPPWDGTEHRAEWVQVIVTSSTLAEYIGDTIKAGMRVLIDGRLRIGHDDGHGQALLEVMASDITMLDASGDGQSNLALPAAIIPLTTPWWEPEYSPDRNPDAYFAHDASDYL